MIKRRHLLATPALLAGAAQAQGFPTRPVTIVVPFAPGSASDIMTRAIAQSLTAEWGVSVVVDNRPGASATVGAAFVARAPADGHTILMGAPPVLVTPMFMPNAGYQPLRDFVPLSMVAYYPLVMTVHPSVPANNLAELLAFARANPGRSYPSPGAGTPVHLLGALLAKQEGLNLVHVSYRGGAQGVTDLIAGLLTFYPGPTIEVLPNIQANRLRAIALLGDRRAALLPAVPTAASRCCGNRHRCGWTSPTPAGATSSSSGWTIPRGRGCSTCRSTWACTAAMPRPSRRWRPTCG